MTRLALSLAAFVAVFALGHDAPPIAPTAALAFFGAGLVAGAVLAFAAMFDVLRTGGTSVAGNAAVQSGARVQRSDGGRS